MPSYSKSHLRIETKKKKERGEAKAEVRQGWLQRHIGESRASLWKVRWGVLRGVSLHPEPQPDHSAGSSCRQAACAHPPRSARAGMEQPEQEAGRSLAAALR